MHTKGPSPVHHDGRGLRIGIIHARWNDKIIEPLLAGTKAKLLECGVQESNILVQSVPGSWELPLAVQRYVSPEHPLPICMHMANSDLGLTNWHRKTQALLRVTSPIVLLGRNRSRRPARELDGRPVCLHAHVQRRRLDGAV